MNEYYPSPAEVYRAVNQIIDICRLAWEKGLIAGWSGNASIRVSENSQLLLITASGSPKGLLDTEDCLLINLKGEKISGKAKVSSESQLHTLLYENFPPIQAVLHTHPPCLQALELAMKTGEAGLTSFIGQNSQNINLYEAQIWGKRLHFAEKYPPGSLALAESAIKAIMTDLKDPEKKPPLPLAVWLPWHGLCAIGENLKDCLCLTEEIEHLARVQLPGSGKF